MLALPTIAWDTISLWAARQKQSIATDRSSPDYILYANPGIYVAIVGSAMCSSQASRCSCSASSVVASKSYSQIEQCESLLRLSRVVLRGRAHDVPGELPLRRRRSPGRQPHTRPRGRQIRPSRPVSRSTQTPDNVLSLQAVEEKSDRASLEPVDARDPWPTRASRTNAARGRPGSLAAASGRYRRTSATFQ